MDCAVACSAYVRETGRGEAAARKTPAGKTRRYEAIPCRMVPARTVARPGEREAMQCVGRLSHGSCRSLWSGKPHAVQGPAAQAVFLMDGETPYGSCLAERLLPHGGIVSPCAVVPPVAVRRQSGAAER